MRSLLVVVFAMSLGIAVQATAQIAPARTWPEPREALLGRVPFECKAIIGCLQFPAVWVDLDTPRGPDAFDKLIRSNDDAVGRRCA